MTCEWGPNALASAVQGPRKQLPAGIYVPPFAINNANNQVQRCDISRNMRVPDAF